jgi:hypothetical protein
MKPKCNGRGTVKRVRQLALLLVPLLASSCLLLNGRCIYELRSLQASGQAMSGADSIAGQVSLFEQRDSDPNKSMYYLLVSPTLKSHVLSASFRDTRNPSQILASLPLDAPTQDPIAEGELSDRNGTSLDGYFELITAGRGILVLEMDLSSSSSITIPLTVTQKQDWTRPYCS